MSEPAAPGSLDPEELAHLAEIARQIRVLVVRTVDHAKAGHLGGPLSAADILATLYFHTMRIRPEEPGWPERDRFVLSKGHSSVALYAAMALRGYFPLEEMATFDAVGSRLQGHPDMLRLPGLDMSTGSLGMGISAGVGIALGLRLAGLGARTYVMLGDGECQEGEVWEAAMVGARYGLDDLVAIVDHNRLQQFGWVRDAAPERVPHPPGGPGELVAKWEAFGWRVLEVDGHDIAALAGTFDAAARPDGRPVAVIAHTVKGKGVSFMEDRYYWHTRAITPEDFAQAMRELGEEPGPAEGAR